VQVFRYEDYTRKEKEGRMKKEVDKDLKKDK
jgi:hypothetical protein